MEIIQLKCPSCGGEINISQKLETIFCNHCGTKFNVPNYNSLNTSQTITAVMDKIKNSAATSTNSTNSFSTVKESVNKSDNISFYTKHPTITKKESKDKSKFSLNFLFILLIFPILFFLGKNHENNLEASLSFQATEEAFVPEEYIHEKGLDIVNQYLNQKLIHVTYSHSEDGINYYFFNIDNANPHLFETTRSEFLKKLYEIDLSNKNLKLLPVMKINKNEDSYAYDGNVFTHNGEIWIPEPDPTPKPTLKPVPQTEAVLGVWVNNWSANSTITIKKVGETYKMISSYGDGSSGTTILHVKNVDGERRFYENPGNIYGDYMVIESGKLAFYDDQGFIYSLSKK